MVKVVSPYFNTHFLNCECQVIKSLVTAREKGGY